MTEEEQVKLVYKLRYSLDTHLYEKHANKLSEKYQIELVRYNGFNLRFLKNPSLKVQLAAVSINSGAIGGIKNPCRELQLKAVLGYSGWIQFIDNPLLEVMILSVRDNPHNINYIPKHLHTSELVLLSKI